MEGAVFLQCLEASLQGQAILNGKGEFLIVNRAFCEQLGYTKEEILLLSIESFVIKEANEDLVKKEPMFQRGIQQKQVEKLILHGNGYLQTTLFTLTDVSNLEQEHYHVQLDKIMTTFNKDDYSLLEARIRDRDEIPLPKKILDGIKDAIITIRLDGQFLYANDAAETIFNQKKEELVNSDFWFQIKKNNDEELLGKFYQLLAGEDYTQFEVYKKDQNEWFDVRAYRSDDQVTLYFINISNRKQMEKELKESELNYRSLVEKSPETISVHDGKELIYINPAGKTLLGIKIFKQGMQISDVLGVQDQTRIRENFRLLLTGKKKMTNSVYTLKRLDGEKFEAEATTTLITFQGKPAFRTILKDMSERKKVDDLIRKSDKLSVVAQLAAGVAHEIRNPLTTVKGFLQLFQKEQKYNPFYISLVMEELVRVESIIYEYLTLAKPNVESVFKKVDLYVLIHQILTLTKAQSNMNNITLEFEYEQVPQIYGLEKQLKQVLINLLRNSIEAVTNSGGMIHVRILNYPDNQVCIQVEDNGCGIAQERIERLGEPFYSTKEKGTGLGLMVCYKIIEHHKGVLNIYSKEGIGTKMEVILPTTSSS